MQLGINTYLENTPYLAPLKEELLLSGSIAYPVHSFFRNGKLISFLTEYSSARNYIIFCDLEGKILVRDFADALPIEHICFCDNRYILVQQGNEGEKQIGFHNGRSIDSTFLFHSKNLFLGPKIFCKVNTPLVIWIEDADRSGLWFGILQNQNLESRRKLTQLEETIYEIDAIFMEGNDLYIAFTSGDNMSLQLAVIASSEFKLLPSLTREYASNITLIPCGDSVYLSWLQKNPATRESTLWIQKLNSRMEDLIEPQQLIHLTGNNNIFDRCTLYSSEDEIIFSILIEQKNKGENFRYFNNPSQETPMNKYVQLIVRYKLNFNELTIHGKIENPGIPYHSGGFYEGKLILIHGMKNPIVSVYSL